MNETSAKVPLRHVTAIIWTHGLARGVLEYAQLNRNRTVQFEIATLEALSEPERLVCDGLIATVGSEAMAARLSVLGVPVVNISGCMAEPTGPSVLSNDEAAGRMAAEHLIGRGFRQFAFIGVREMGYSVRRWAGFVNALIVAGLPYYDLRFSEALFHSANVAGALAERIAELPKPVGIMVDSDVRARWVLEGCRAAGAEVPGEIGLVGADNNLACCAGLVPTVSSVDMNHERIGFEAAALIERLLNGQHAPAEPIIVEPRGVQARQSTDVLASADSAVAAASRFIRNHAHESITIGDVVKALSISRRSLEGRYRKVTGRSPHEDLQRVRLERARELLIHTSLPLADIAGRCGYNYPALMYRAFRKQMSITPGQYRRQFGTQGSGG